MRDSDGLCLQWVDKNSGLSGETSVPATRPTGSQGSLGQASSHPGPISPTGKQRDGTRALDNLWVCPPLSRKLISRRRNVFKLCASVLGAHHSAGAGHSLLPRLPLPNGRQTGEPPRGSCLSETCYFTSTGKNAVLRGGLLSSGPGRTSFPEPHPLWTGARASPALLRTRWVTWGRTFHLSAPRLPRHAKGIAHEFTKAGVSSVS